MLLPGCVGDRSPSTSTTTPNTSSPSEGSSVSAHAMRTSRGAGERGTASAFRSFSRVHSGLDLGESPCVSTFDGMPPGRPFSPSRPDLENQDVVDERAVGPGALVTTSGHSHVKEDARHRGRQVLPRGSCALLSFPSLETP